MVILIHVGQNNPLTCDFGGEDVHSRNALVVQGLPGAVASFAGPHVPGACIDLSAGDDLRQRADVTADSSRCKHKTKRSDRIASGIGAVSATIIVLVRAAYEYRFRLEVSAFG